MSGLPNPPRWTRTRFLGSRHPFVAAARSLAQKRALGARWPVAALLSSALLCTASAPRAATADLPPDCGTQAALQAELERRLPAGTSLDTTHVAIEPRGDELLLRVQVGSELRELRDHDCNKLFRAAIVVVVAILAPDLAEPQPVGLIDPSAGDPSAGAGDPSTAPSAAPSPSAPTPSAAPSPSARSKPAPAPAPARREPELTAGFGAGVNLGLLPDPVLALELESKLLWSRLGLSANFRYLPFPAEHRDANGRGVEVSALGGAVAGVARPFWFLEARLGASAYRLSGTGLGSEANTADAAWSAGPLAGLDFLPLQLEWLWAGAAAETQLDLIRPHFDIDGYGEVFAVPRVSGWGMLRAGLFFR